MKLPKYRNSVKLGEDGITILKGIIEAELEWLFRTNHKEHDFGIDAYIDVISEKGHITGKTIAIQVKTGQSYFGETNKIGWVYRGQVSHLNYYLNHDIPVVIILINEKEKKAFWCHCDSSKTEKAGDSWKITIPFNQELKKESKLELFKFISPVKNYVSQLEHFWDMNKKMKEVHRLVLIVDKPEIINADYQNIALTINRIQVNSELIDSMIGKVDIWIHGYDDDRRELYEIKEVKDWIDNLLSVVRGWSYFLSKDEYASFLKLAFLCNIEFSKTLLNENFQTGEKKYKLEYDKENAIPFIKMLFADLNLFCYKNNIDEELNWEISERVMKYLAGDMPEGIGN